MANCRNCGQPIWFLQDGLKDDGSKKWVPMSDEAKTVRHDCQEGPSGGSSGGQQQAAAPAVNNALQDDIQYLKAYVEVIGTALCALLDGNHHDDGSVQLTAVDFYAILDEHIRKPVVAPAATSPVEEAPPREVGKTY